MKPTSQLVIEVKLDEVLKRSNMTLTELSNLTGLTIANLSILKTGKARAIRFSSLVAICQATGATPGDILGVAPAELPTSG